MPRAIGQLLLKLGEISYSTSAGNFYGIGLGILISLASCTCCEIGTIITNKAGNEYGDIVISTRTDVPATEKIRIMVMSALNQPHPMYYYMLVEQLY
jgi:hypothetical protein